MHKLGAVALTPGERFARGKEYRKRVRRADHGEWKASKTRRDVVQMLLVSARGRLRDLMPIKMARMAASHFGFFRGAASIMAADLASIPHCGLEAQICGDAHVRNLGAYAAPDGHLVFDINDFDETVHGPFEWDLKRLSTSLILAGQQSGHEKKTCKDAVRLFIKSYCAAMLRFSEMTVLDLTKFQLHVKVGPVQAVLRKAERSTPEHNLERLTLRSGGKHKFKDERPLLAPVRSQVARQVIAALALYQQTLSPERQQFLSCYHPVDVAFKVVGTGSVGTRDYVVLCFGNGERDPLFLQVKEEAPSCYARYLSPSQAFINEGKRVAEGQRRMQAYSDPFLGWTSMGGRDYLVRQLSDHKATIDDSQMQGNGLTEYAKVCGEVLAKGHARSGDPMQLAGYCGAGNKLDDAMAEFADRYGEQTVRDFEALKKAIKTGKIRISTEVKG
ncbi:MAG TPA: DUF2252 domain-containing protein [Terriglobales bacterium]|jgi:uncharacterized protein (DUF2252 family)|nr:DUF2252 domain-containing protein [Terriglobales bacterium]